MTLDTMKVLDIYDHYSFWLQYTIVIGARARKYTIQVRGYNDGLIEKETLHYFK